MRKFRFRLPEFDVPGLWVLSLGIWFHIVSRLVRREPEMAILLAQIIGVSMALWGGYCLVILFGIIVAITLSVKLTWQTFVNGMVYYWCQTLAPMRDIFKSQPVYTIRYYGHELKYNAQQILQDKYIQWCADQVCRAALKDDVAAMGYETETVGKHGMWELKGVPTEPYSSRSRTISEAVGDDASLKSRDVAALDTRQSKQKVDPEQRMVEWMQTLKETGFDIKAYREAADLRVVQGNMRVPENVILTALSRGGCIRTFWRASASTAGQQIPRIPLRTNGRYAIMHDKVIIVDNHTVESGSFNFTRTAASRNSENVLVIKDVPEVAQAYLQHWQSRWDGGTEWHSSY